MKICSVIVTYNRKPCLEKALASYSGQTRTPDYLVVVDNSSTDGTGEFLSAWEKGPADFKKYVIHLPENIGGSGGFHAGMQYAMKLDCDWIWISDDDAYLDSHALKALEQFIAEHSSVADNAAALCSMVTDYNGSAIGLGHRVRNRFFLTVPCIPKPVPEEEYNRDWFSFDALSYVGVMLRKEALEKSGLVNKDFFIYSDDHEHSIRLRKYGSLICVPSSIVRHEGESSKISFIREAVWRDYYATRNVLLMLKWHYGWGAFYFRAFCRLLTAIKSGNPKKVKIFWAGIRDAQNDIVGLHPVYRPGWKEK